MDIRLGLSVPIYNYRFNRASKIVSTIQSVSGYTASVNKPSWLSTNWERYFGTDINNEYRSAGINSIVLGASTHLSNVGATEYARVISTSGTTITCDRTFKYLYSANDPVTLVGAGIPDGWTSYGWHASPCSIIGNGNYFDMFGLDVKFTSPSGQSYLWNKVGQINYRENYLIEVHYKNDTNSYARIHLSDKTLDDFDILTFPVSSTFTAASKLFAPASNTDIPLYLILAFAAQTSRIQISNISITHLPHDQDNALYTFSDLIDLGSLIVTPVTGSSVVKRNINGLGYVENANVVQGLTPVRYKLKFTISNCPATSYIKFRKLLSWQEQGHLVNFFPNLEGLPHCLTGIFSMPNQKNNIGNMDLRNLSITFEETGIV